MVRVRAFYVEEEAASKEARAVNTSQGMAPYNCCAAMKSIEDISLPPLPNHLHNSHTPMHESGINA